MNNNTNNTNSLVNINLRENKTYLNTKKTKELIEKGEEIDFNKIAEENPNYKVDLYKIETENSDIGGCSLKVKNYNQENEKKLNLTFKLGENPSDKFVSNCEITSQNKKLICTLNEKTILNKNLIMEDYLYYDNNSMVAVYFPNKKTKLPSSCYLKSNIISSRENDSSSKNKVILIIIIGLSLILLVLITVIICYCKKCKKPDFNEISNNTTNNVHGKIDLTQTNSISNPKDVY